jgi:hypothetical protein
VPCTPKYGGHGPPYKLFIFCVSLQVNERIFWYVPAYSIFCLQGGMQYNGDRHDFLHRIQS